MAGIGLEVRALARKDMGSEVSTTTIDVHAHLLPDFYRDALLVAGLRQADGIAQLPAWEADLRGSTGQSKYVPV